MSLFFRNCRTLKLHGWAWTLALLAGGLHAPGQFVATGADEGVGSQVKAFRGADLKQGLSLFPYSPTFNGGVRVAVGDVNGDVMPDIITAPGAGTRPIVKAFDGRSGTELRSFLAFDSAFTGGVYVAVGDVNGDGLEDIVGGTGDGATAQVKAFSGTGLTVISSFFPYGPNFTGGVRVAAGDVDGDGIAEIITGSASGAAHVKIFSGQTQAEIGSFFPYGATFQGGVSVAAGDVNGDGRADIVTGAGPGGGPHVKVFDGATKNEIASFFAYDAGFTGGVRVALGDVDGDGRAEIICAPGAGGAPQVKAFDVQTRAEVRSFLAYDSSFSGGVFVGGRAPRGSARFTVTTLVPTDVSFTTAALHGVVNANDGVATVKFQYGAGANFGSIVAAKPSEVSGRTVTTVGAGLSGLSPGTTYSARLIATDALGDSTFGETVIFTTTINNAPTPGSFEVVPLSPVSVGTALTANFSGWTDQEGHTPLSYEVRESDTVLVPAAPAGTVTFFVDAGPHQVYGRVYDTLGDFTDTAPVEIVVVGDPESALLYTTGDPVPGAGTGGIPANAKWMKFGVPAIDDLGQVAFAGKWVSTSGKGGAIFHTTAGVVALTGGVVPGAGAGDELALPQGAVFENFKDPVIDIGGIVAFIATIAGKGVTAANDTVVVSNARTGALEVIAREGSPAPGTNGARIKFFHGVCARASQGQRVPLLVQPGGTVFTASLAGAGPREDFGAWWLPPGRTSPILLTREGGEGFAPGETIRRFILHESLAGSPGQGRGQIDADKALLQVTLSSGKQAMVLATPGALENFTQTGDLFDENSSVWLRMSQPSAGNIGQFLSVLGTFAPAPATASSRPGIGILRSSDSGKTWAVLAGVGRPVGGSDSIWIDLGYPVNSSTGADLAFRGKTTAPTGAASEGIWWLPESGSLQRIASQGEQAAGCAAGEKWLAFESVALPGGTFAKPLFAAYIEDLDNPKSRRRSTAGVWAVDRAGSVRLLFREGTTMVGDKSVKTFNVLREVRGSPGVTRAFNTRGQVTWQATFADGTSGIVVTQVP